MAKFEIQQSVPKIEKALTQYWSQTKYPAHLNIH